MRGRKHVPADTWEKRREWDIWAETDVSDEPSLLWPGIVPLWAPAPHAVTRSLDPIISTDITGPGSIVTKDDCKPFWWAGCRHYIWLTSDCTLLVFLYNDVTLRCRHYPPLAMLQADRHLESSRVSLFSIDCHFLSYDRHWQGGVPRPSVWFSMHRSPIKYPFYSVSS